MSATDTSLVSSTVCLVIRFGRLGITRKLSDDQWQAGDAEKRLLHASKKILDSPEYKAVAALEGSVKHWLRAQALPSRLYRDSTYLIPLKSMAKVDAKLTESRIEWGEKVAEFMSTYPARKAETMASLGCVADPADYGTPEEVRAEFLFDYEYVTLATPSTLKQISAEMFAREEARLQERLQSAESEIVAHFRGRFLKMVEDMKAMLAGEQTKTGRTMAFGGWRIDRLNDYVAKFLHESNVCRDAELAETMHETSKLLSGIDPKELKKDDAWRESLGRSFADLAERLGTMVKVKGKRIIEDDE